MPKVNNIKMGQWFSFKCEKCDINKNFTTEKERLNCYLRHQKFCDIANCEKRQIITKDKRKT